MMKLKYIKSGVIVSLNMTRVEGVPWFYNNLDSSVATLARRTLLTSSVVQLEMMYPGFQEGALLKEYYNPDSWRPTDEYMNKALFAGQETYEGLKVNFNVALGSFLETHTPKARFLLNILFLAFSNSAIISSSVPFLFNATRLFAR